MALHRAMLLKITGDKALDRRLARLKTRDASTISRKAVNAAITVLAQAQRNAAPNKHVKKAIGKRNSKSKRTGEVMAKACVQVSKTKARNFPHAHLLVLGTDERETKAGHGRGRMTPHKFLEQATKGALGSAVAAARSKAAEELRKVRP